MSFSLEFIKSGQLSLSWLREMLRHGLHCRVLVVSYCPMWRVPFPSTRTSCAQPASPYGHALLHIPRWNPQGASAGPHHWPQAVEVSQQRSHAWPQRLLQHLGDDQLFLSLISRPSDAFPNGAKGNTRCGSYGGFRVNRRELVSFFPTSEF